VKVKDRVLKALRALEARRPHERITIADVARRAKVTWPTASRHLGGQRGLDALLERRPPPPPDTRERLLAASARCFAKNGYPATTLDDVALEAGLTKGAVYWHFQGKRDLLLAMMKEHVSPQQLEPALAVELLALSRDPDVRAALVTWSAEGVDLGAIAGRMLGG
jgi:AcrR family transcriptional regulator